MVVDGETLWLDPTTRPRATRPRRAFLFQTFDEAALTYPTTGFARRSPEATRSRLLSEAGGGIIVLDHEDVGVWKRTVGKETVVVDLHLDVPLIPDDLEQVEGAAAALAAFIDRPLDLRVHATFDAPARSLKTGPAGSRMTRPARRRSTGPARTKGVAPSARDTTPSGVLSRVEGLRVLGVVLGAAAPGRRDRLSRRG